MSKRKSGPKPDDFLTRESVERNKLKTNERGIERKMRHLLPSYESAVRDVRKHVPTDVWERFVRVHDKALELQESLTAMGAEWAWHVGKITTAHLTNFHFANHVRRVLGGQATRVVEDADILAWLRAWKKERPGPQTRLNTIIEASCNGLYAKEKTHLATPIAQRQLWKRLKHIAAPDRPSVFWRKLQP